MIRFTNGADFRDALKKHPVYLRNVLRDVLIEVSIVAFRSVVEGKTGFGNPSGTPVQTGYARGSWYVENGPPTITAHPRPRAGYGGEKVDPMGAQTVSSGSAVIVSSATLGTPLHFVNGADYTVMLEYGHSDQAPQGMVRLAVQDGQAILDSVVRRL